MSRGKKAVLIAAAAVCLVLCVGCCLYIWQFVRGAQLSAEISKMAAVTPSAPNKPSPERLEETDQSPEIVDTEVTEIVDEITAPSVTVSVDFDALSALNDEIYAWIEVPGTNISYPILQSASDDLFYSSHNVDRSYFSGGCIFTQRYNGKDFSDPMTLVYGHNFHDQSVFAPLLQFTEAGFFRDNRQIWVYTRDAAYRYEIFAAYPHSSEHLLLCYDFTDEGSFNGYFSALSDSVINANYRRDEFPAFGDKVLTLSTCYRYSRGRRFLVQAVLTDTYEIVWEAADES